MMLNTLLYVFIHGLILISNDIDIEPQTICNKVLCNLLKLSYINQSISLQGVTYKEWSEGVHGMMGLYFPYQTVTTITTRTTAPKNTILVLISMIFIYIIIYKLEVI